MAAGTPLDADGVSRVPTSACPVCHHTLDAAGTMPGERTPRPPEPGDHTICMACLAVLTYTDTMGVRHVPPAELSALPMDELIPILQLRADLQRFQAAMGMRPGASQN
jgi:hypothetical protein